ncbi:MAG TPA: hypothetical protein DCX54_13425 [Flavobacteriales bacterium]|nr:hypothetical protein [Flavobacteriales bacterium]
MRKSIVYLLFISSLSAYAQPALDGFMRGKYNLDLAPSVSYETYGQYFSKLNNKVSVSRTSIPVSMYAAYGITDWLDVQTSIPYVYTEPELSGMQDFSVYVKGKLVDRQVSEGDYIKLLLSIGGKTPMSRYETQSVNSIGQADTAVDCRVVLQYSNSDGFFAMAQGGYTARVGMVPSSTPLAFKIGWAKEKFYLDIWYDQQWAFGGNDYQDVRDGKKNISFRSFGVSYGKLGITYYKPFGKRSGFSSGLSYVMWGRNIGQAIIVSAGFVHRLNFSAE